MPVRFPVKLCRACLPMLLAVCAWSWPTAMSAESSAAGTPSLSGPADICEATDMCDLMPLRAVEGIWRITEDNVSVAILRDNHEEGIYNISVVESDNVSLRPGTVIGKLTDTTDAGKFRLRLFSKFKHGVPASPCDLSATLSSDGESMAIEGIQLKIRIVPNMLLPGLWKMLRFNVSNPSRKLRKGFTRIYPAYDGNGSSRRNPLYL